MTLTDTTIRLAKTDGSDRKLADSKGLYLLVTATGSKLWRLKYRINGKEKKLALGSYPEVGLKEARAVSKASAPTYLQTSCFGHPAAPNYWCRRAAQLWCDCTSLVFRGH